MVDSPNRFSESRLRMRVFDLPPRMLPLALRASSCRGLLVKALGLGWLVVNVRHGEAPTTNDRACTRVNGIQRTAVVLNMFEMVMSRRITGMLVQSLPEGAKYYVVHGPRLLPRQVEMRSESNRDDSVNHSLL